jgi:hypothetical protein
MPDDKPKDGSADPNDVLSPEQHPGTLDWDAIGAIVDRLNFAEEFQRERRPYAELDEHGEIIWWCPDEGG